MAKWSNDIILDTALNYVKNNATGETLCSGQPAGYYSACNGALWQASHSYSIGDAVYPSTRNGFMYECVTAGDSGATEPAPWATIEGGTTADNTAVWAARTSNVLAGTTVSLLDINLSDGDTDGRKFTVASKNNLIIHTAGTGNHVSLFDDTNKNLLIISTTNAQAVDIGNLININAWSDTIRDPA
jgi:hypothetical protein